MIYTRQQFLAELRLSRTKGSTVDSRTISDVMKMSRHMHDIDDRMDNDDNISLSEAKSLARRLNKLREELVQILERDLSVASDDPELQKALLNNIQLIILHGEEIEENIAEVIKNKGGRRADKIEDLITSDVISISDLESLPNYVPLEDQEGFDKIGDGQRRDSRKMKAALRKLANAEKKVSKSIKYLKREKWEVSAAYCLEAEKKLSKILDKKLEAMSSLGDVQQVIIARVAQLNEVIREIESEIRKSGDEGAIRIIDKREVDSKIRREAEQTEQETGAEKLNPGSIATTATMPSLHGKDDTTSSNSTGSNNDDTTQSTSTVTNAYGLNWNNIHLILKPDWYRRNKIKPKMNKKEALERAKILYRARLGNTDMGSNWLTRVTSLGTTLGTDEEAIEKVLIDNMPNDPASYSFLSEVYQEYETKTNFYQSADDLGQMIYNELDDSEKKDLLKKLGTKLGLS